MSIVEMQGDMVNITKIFSVGRKMFGCTHKPRSWIRVKKQIIVFGQIDGAKEYKLIAPPIVKRGSSGSTWVHWKNAIDYAECLSLKLKKMVVHELEQKNFIAEVLPEKALLQYNPLTTTAKWNGKLRRININNPPYGYTYNSQNCSVTTNTFERAVIESIITMRKEGFGYKYIAKTINNKGIRTKRGCIFSCSTVKRILASLT